MPRITVTVDSVDSEKGSPRVLLDEHVRGVHLEDELSSVQFLERLAWAIEDGERLERIASLVAMSTDRWGLPGR